MRNLKQRIVRIEQGVGPDGRCFVVNAGISDIEAGLVDEAALVREKYGVGPTGGDLVVVLARFAAVWERGWTDRGSP